MNSRLLENVAQDQLTIPPFIGRSIRRKLLKSPAVWLPVSLPPARVHIVKTLQVEGTLHSLLDEGLKERRQVGILQVANALGAAHSPR